MAIGARFRTPTGAIQIDSGYTNHMLRSKGTLVTASTGYGYIDVTCEAPLIAFRCATAMCAILRIVQVSATVRRYWFCTHRQTQIIGDRVSASVEWWLFDKAGYGEMFNTPYSLRIRNPLNGEVVFDARGKYVRVDTTITGRQSVFTNDGGDTRFSSGFNFSGTAPKCAVIQGAPVNGFEAVLVGAGINPDYMLFWRSSMVRATGDNTFYGRTQVWQQEGPYDSSGGIDYGPPYRRDYYSYWVVDVTDF